MIVKPKIYIETSVISYLAACPSRDLVIAAHQQITHDWWRKHRGDFDLYVSEIVEQEARGGDQDAAKRRLEILEGIPSLNLTEEVYSLARPLTENVPLPETATVDAFHIAVAAVNGSDYLLTWNCRHIANATLRGRIEDVCRKAGFEPPIICTPDEFMEE